MNGGTIFVLCLAAAFLFFVMYLARLSRAAKRQAEDAKRQAQSSSDRSQDAPPLRRAG